MNDRIAERILDAVRSDDVKAFENCMKEAPCEAIRLGRFPILSLFYLYAAKRLIRKYEREFIAAESWQEFEEPAQILSAFRAAAGKCLRLYQEEIVTPAEMLLLLDETKRLKKIYPLCKLSASRKERLKEIYRIKYMREVSFEGDHISLERRPFTRREKRRLAIRLVSVALALAILVSTPFIVNIFVPFIPTGNRDGVKLFEVDSLDKINFSSQNEYILTKDVTLPANYMIESMNCTLDGDGHSLTLSGENPLVGTLGGKIKNINISSTRPYPLVESVSVGATLDRISLSVAIGGAQSGNFGFIARTNYGLIQNVSLSVRGKVNIAGSATEAHSDGFLIGGIAALNSQIILNAQPYFGTVEGCSARYEGFLLEGEVASNASFGGIVGGNNGYVKNCTASGDVTSDTVDLAGICSINDGELSFDESALSLIQTAASEEWNPLAAGIVLTNNAILKNCTNRGKVSSTSTCTEIKEEDKESTDPSVVAAGIAYVNTGTVLYCQNYGDVEGRSQKKNVYASGICVISNGALESCINASEVKSESASSRVVYVSGIIGVAYGYAYKSLSSGTLTARGDNDVYAGGICASGFVETSSCMFSGEMSVSGRTIYAGGILGYAGVVSSYGSVYFGRVKECISSGRIRIGTVKDSAFAGGLIGCVDEMSFLTGNADGLLYLGGGACASYFTGELQAGSGTYVGGVAGGCGMHIFDSNSYVSSGTEYHNFENNSYAAEGVSLAIGLAVTMDKGGNRIVKDGSDLGAQKKSREEISSLDAYQALLKIFE